MPDRVPTDDERCECKMRRKRGREKEARDDAHLTGSCLQADLKSAILSAGKRARLKHNPSRVRFSEGVVIGTPPHTVSIGVF